MLIMPIPRAYAQQLIPSDISGLSLWLTGDSIYTSSYPSVDTCYDLSIYSNNSFQNILAQRPVSSPSILNGHNTIRFDGDGDCLYFNEISDIRTIFWVVKEDPDATWGRHLLGALSSYDFHRQDRMFWNSSYTNSSILSGTTRLNFNPVNGLITPVPYQFSIISLVTTGNVIADNFSRDRTYDSRVWDGELAELIIYNQPLTQIEVQAIENYLNEKYAPPVNLGNDITSSNLCPITLNAGNNYVNYTWSTTAANPSDTMSSISVLSSGQYSVTVTNVFGKVSVDTINVQYPYTQQTDHTTCLFDTLTIITGLNHAYTFLWSNSSTDSLLNITEAGLYWVEITDSTALHCSIRDTFAITVDSFAVIASLGNDSSFCSGNSISLTSGALEAVNYLWNDNSTNTSLIVFSTGNYWVSVTNSRGCSAKDTIHLDITGIAPITGFYYTDTCYGDQTAFTDTSYTLDGSIIDTWQWIINGDTATTQNTTTTLNSPGNHQVSLSVTTSNNCSGSTSSNVHINARPDVNFSYTINNQQLTVFFTSITSGIISYLWTFGDGDQSTDINPTHIYSSAGSYQVSLFVTDSLGCTNTITKTIYNLGATLPSDISGLSLWLTGDSVYTSSYPSVDTCYDLSIHSNNSFQNIVAQRPISAASILNGHRTIRFDGDGDCLYFNEISDIRTVFWVVKEDPNATWGRHLLGALSTYDFYRQSSTIWNSDYTNSSILSGTTRLNFNPVNGLITPVPYQFSIISLVTTGYVRADNFSRDRTYDSRVWDGELAELIIYDQPLTQPEVQDIENYLNDKYAPSVNLGNDINSSNLCPITLNAGNNYVHYTWNTTEANPADTLSTLNVLLSGQYSVTVTNVFGKISVDTINVVRPSYNLQSDREICPFDTLAINTGFNHAYTFLWSDSSTDSLLNITDAGVYWVEITDTTTFHCAIRDTFAIALDSFAVTTSLGPDRSACRGEILGLEVGQQEATTYAWSTGSGDPQVMISNAPETSQDYAVTVTNAIGCEARDTVNIFVRGDVPMPGFSADSVCPGAGTSFTDLSGAVPPALPNAWDWDFGDGNSSTDQHPTHVYAQSGLYNVTLIVTTDSGCSKPITKPVIVWAKPTVFFSPTNGCSGVSVPFHDYSTNTLGTNEQWWWDFGEPGTADTSVEQHPTWSYALPGNYTVSLMVTSAAGCMDTLQRTIDVRETLPVGFMVSQSCLGQKIYFVDTTATDPWSQIVERKWFFGDGDSSVFASPTHVYDTVGTYNVTLKVKSLNGCSVTKTIPVVVYPVPVAGIRNTNLCVTVPGQLMDSSSISGDVINSWRWIIGESVTSTQQYPWFTPDSVGPVNVQLIVGSSNQCSDTAIRNLTVYPLPHAEFSYTPDFGTAPLEVDFTNLSTGESNWVWVFGDGGNSISENPQYTFEAQGIFPVTLTVYSAYGCPHSVTHNMYVIMLINDIAVTDVQTVNSPTALSMKVRLLNNGTRTIEALTLKARFNGSNVIAESWNGTLAPGQMLDYTFNAQFELTADQQVDYVCIEAETDGYADDRPENNSDCDVLNETFVVSNPYPNPVSGELILDVILPFADELTIAVYDESGKRMAQIFDAKGPKGYTRYFFDASRLEAGAYAIHVRFRGKREVKKFVKQ